LGILLGVAIIASQLQSMSSISQVPDDNRIIAISLLSFGIGVAISVGSFLYMMRILYDVWCIIPPEWENILCNKNESPLIKSLIILYIIQWILIIPVIIYSLTRISKELGGIFNFPTYVCIINILYLVLLFLGSTIFSQIYENWKSGDEKFGDIVE
jgi:hypothetical protein